MDKPDEYMKLFRSTHNLTDLSISVRMRVLYIKSTFAKKRIPISEMAMHKLASERLDREREGWKDIPGHDNAKIDGICSIMKHVIESLN